MVTKTAATAVAEANQQLMEELITAIEKDFLSAPRCFRKAILHLNST